MSETEELKRLQLAVKLLQRDVGNLMSRGLDLEIELAMRQDEIERLKEAAKPARKAKK